VGPRNAAATVLDCLSRLDYRGYDSCGITVLDGDSLFYRRRVGRIDKLRDETLNLAPLGHVAIGHTRWATHGGVDTRNAHPLMSCDGAISVVHNGTIENYDLLRSRLREQGHFFSSDTDSEVIPHLLEQGVREGKTFDQSFYELPRALHGSYAVLAVHRGCERIYAVRKDAALVVGIGSNELFPSSDIPSFLPLTPKTVYVDEGDCLVLDGNGIRTLERVDGELTLIPDNHPITTLSADEISISKDGFDHFMIKEILEQMHTIERECQLDLAGLQEAVKLLDGAEGIWLLGAGTSYHAGLFGEYLFQKFSKHRAWACVSSEFEFRDEFVTSHSAAIALSQSGETADTILAARAARERGARLIAITNVPQSRLAAMADVVIPLHSGREIAVAATKSYTSELAVLILLAHCFKADVSAGQRMLLLARDSILNITSDASRRHLLGIANELVGAKSIFLLGRGPHRITALEAGLKMKEVSRIHSEAFPSGEMKHGPLALIEEGTPVVLFYDQSSQPQSEIAGSEFHSRGARVYSVGPKPLQVSANHIKVADAGLATPIAHIVPMQILAYEVARIRNVDPDYPRNLAKSVTVV